MNSSGKFLTAVFAGMAAGLVMGLLFAPDKGSVTRKKIMDGAADLTDKVKSTAEETINKIGKRVKASSDQLAGEVDQ